MMLDFIAKHKYGIIGTAVFHFLLLVYFSMSDVDVLNYQKKTSALLELDYRDLNEVEEENIEELEKEIEELEKQLTDQEIYEKINNMMRDANYVPKSQENNSQNNYQSEKTIEEQLEEKYKQLEQEIIAQRGADGKHFEAPEDIEKNNTKEDNNQENNNQGAKSQPTGTVTGVCDVPGRNCNAKIPAYRCPAGGKIHIDIKVNQKGEVTSARVNQGMSTSSNTCLVNEALKYAKRSWVNQDFKGPSSVDGSITYIFVSQ